MRDLARDDELVILHRNRLLLKETLQCSLRFQIENRLDTQPFAAASYGGRRETLSQHRAQGVDEDGLARARLTRQDVQPRTKFDFHMLQKGKIPNRQCL